LNTDDTIQDTPSTHAPLWTRESKYSHFLNSKPHKDRRAVYENISSLDRKTTLNNIILPQLNFNPSNPVFQIWLRTELESLLDDTDVVIVSQLTCSLLQQAFSQTTLSVDSTTSSDSSNASHMLNSQLEPYLSENTPVFIRELFLKLTQLFVKKKIPHLRQPKIHSQDMKHEAEISPPSFIPQTDNWKENKQGNRIVIEFEGESTSSSPLSSVPFSSSASSSSVSLSDQNRRETIDLID